MTDYSKFKLAEAFKHLDVQHGLVDDISTGFSSIRYRGKQWSLQHGGKTYPFRRDDDGTPRSFIEFVVLGISPGTSKAYFGDEQWTEDSASGPICTSRKGDVPDPGTPVPQSPSCGTCSHNEWITKPGGGRGKECQDHKRIAALLMPAMTKKMFNGTPLIEPVHLKIPPGSFRTMKAYFDDLSSQGFPFQAVVTRVSFSPDRLFEMSFEMTQALTNDEAKVVFKLMEEPVTKQILNGGAAVRAIEGPKPQQQVRQDTGLMEAFGATATYTQTHTQTHTNVPDENMILDPPDKAPKTRKPRTAKPMTISEPDGRSTAAPPPPTGVAVPDESNGSWDASDDELDSSVAKLMGAKLDNMLK